MLCSLASAMYFGLDSEDLSENGSVSPLPFRRFQDEAQELFNAWYIQLERRIRSGDEPPAFRSLLAKYRSLLPSLALLYHLLSGDEGDVSVEAFEAARKWCKYLQSHARRIYAPAFDPGRDAARRLLKRLRQGDLKDGFTLRDLYRKGWTGLDNKEGALEAVRELLAHKWLRKQAINEGKGGQATVRYSIHPKTGGHDS